MFLRNPPFATMTDINETLAERGKHCGRFITLAELTQDLKTVAANAMPIGHTLAADQQEALDMIFHKIGRIINGDPDYVDSWRDIAGYAQLVVNRLEGEDE